MSESDRRTWLHSFRMMRAVCERELVGWCSVYATNEHWMYNQLNSLLFQQTSPSSSKCNPYGRRHPPIPSLSFKWRRNTLNAPDISSTCGSWSQPPWHLHLQDWMYQWVRYIDPGRIFGVRRSRSWWALKSACAVWDHRKECELEDHSDIVQRRQQ